MTPAEKLLKLQKLKKQLEEQQQYAAGRLAELRNELLTKHNCQSIEEAEELLESLKRKQDRFMKRIQSLQDRFDRKFNKLMEEIEALTGEFDGDE